MSYKTHSFYSPEYMSLLFPPGVQSPVEGYDNYVKPESTVQVPDQEYYNNKIVIEIPEYESMDMRDEFENDRVGSVDDVVYNNLMSAKVDYDFGSGVDCRYGSVFKAKIHYDPLLKEGICQCGAKTTNKFSYVGGLFVAINSLQFASVSEVREIISTAQRTKSQIFIMLPQKLLDLEIDHSRYLEELGLVRGDAEGHIIYHQSASITGKYRTLDGYNTDIKEDGHVKCVIMFPEDTVIGVKSQSGYFDYPVCGTLESKETPLQCAMREMKEELNVSEQIIYHGVIEKNDRFYVFSFLPGRYASVKKKYKTSRGQLTELTKDMVHVRSPMWDIYVMLGKHYGINLARAYDIFLSYSRDIKIPLAIKDYNPYLKVNVTKELKVGDYYRVTSNRDQIRVDCEGHRIGVLVQIGVDLYKYKKYMDKPKECRICGKAHEESMRNCLMWYTAESAIRDNVNAVQHVKKIENVIHAAYPVSWITGKRGCYPKIDKIKIGDIFRMMVDYVLYKVTVQALIVSRQLETIYSRNELTGSARIHGGNILLMDCVFEIDK